jgi:hypothetical protein
MTPHWLSRYHTLDPARLSPTRHPAPGLPRPALSPHTTDRPGPTRPDPARPGLTRPHSGPARLGQTWPTRPGRASETHPRVLSHSGPRHAHGPAPARPSPTAARDTLLALIPPHRATLRYAFWPRAPPITLARDTTTRSRGGGRSTPRSTTRTRMGGKVHQCPPLPSGEGGASAQPVRGSGAQ